jgi:hypothetical protein
LRRVGRTQFEGHLDLSASGELGNVILGKAKLEAEGGSSAGREREIESEPIGKTPADLSWVARVLRASGKRLVVEDFHYVTVEDIRLTWDESNLTEVLRLGSEALNIELSPEIRAGIVADAYGNVGLVQRLAEQLCLRAGVLETLPHRRKLDDEGPLETARESVSQRMKARYDAFADDFVRGMNA